MENLSHKEKTFVKAILEGENGTQAALKAYDTESYHTAGVIAHENLKKPKIQNAIAEALPDELLAQRHMELLNSTKLEHMIFPTGPKNAKELAEQENATPLPEVELEAQPHGGALKREHKKKDDVKLTDDDIRELLAEVNCKVRKIVHGETARHVYFWAADNKARKDALDMAYEIKGTYAPKKSVNLNVEVEASDAVKEATKTLNDFYRGTSIRSDGETSSPVGDEALDKERGGDADRLHEEKVPLGHIQRPESEASTPEASTDRRDSDEHAQEPMGSKETPQTDNLHASNAG